MDIIITIINEKLKKEIVASEKSTSKAHKK